MTKLEILQVEKSFGTRPVLQEVTFACVAGEITGIFGRNGSGKSSLLKIIFGTLKYNRFEALLNHQAYLPALNIKKQQIAYLPQHNFLPNNKKVRQIVSLFYTDPAIQDSILYNPLIARHDSVRFGQLSDGEKRYFEILLISHLPHELMIFDEPFSMIAPLEQESISDLLQTLKKDKIIIITDHYYRKVLKIADQHLLMYNGRCGKIASAAELSEGAYLGNRRLSDERI